MKYMMKTKKAKEWNHRVRIFIYHDLIPISPHSAKWHTHFASPRKLLTTIFVYLDVCHMEGLIPKLHGHDAIEIPGARNLLNQIISPSEPTTAPWAIVTSGTVPLVSGWLSALSLPRPEHLVTAESVDNGKPDPACYQLGLDRLGLREHAGEVLVLEDSPAGVKAGKAAGCKVLGLVTSHTAEQVLAAGPDWAVKDLESVKVLGAGEAKGTVRFEIRGTLVGAGR